jgi:hypothetical protein
MHVLYMLPIQISIDVNLFILWYVLLKFMCLHAEYPTISAVDEGGWFAFCFSCFTHGESTPDIYWFEDWMDTEPVWTKH